MHIKLTAYLIRFFVWLDNICYTIISKLAIKDNGGVHPKHKILDYHRFFVNNIHAHEIVLDIGCGKGENAYDIVLKAKRVVAIDNKDGNITYAKKHFKRDNLIFVLGDVLTYHFDTRFDKIVLSNVLEHIDDRVEFLKKMHGISDVILLRVPMLDRDWLTVYKKNNNLEYRLDPTHYIEYTLPILEKELHEAGWQIQKYSIQFGEFWGVITT